MNDKQKRSAHYTINLTEEQAQQVEKLASKERRKPSELIYILVADCLIELEQ